MGQPTLRVLLRGCPAISAVVNGKHEVPAGSYKVRLRFQRKQWQWTPSHRRRQPDCHLPGHIAGHSLKAVVIYDGAWTYNNATTFMSQTISGFYDATGSQALGLPSSLTS